MGTGYAIIGVEHIKDQTRHWGRNFVNSRKAMTRQFLSVAMCTYNGAKYLQEQLYSIAFQTRLPDEVVICDDCSTDNTLEILENFKKTAPFHVKIYKNEKNLGSTKNFEKAISLCSGNIIALSDQDDVWIPKKLEKLEQALNSDPKTGYVFSNALVVDENLQSLGYTMWDRIKFFSKDHKRFKDGHQVEVLLRRNVVTGATMAFRAELRNVILPIPEQWIHDAWIALLLSSIGKKGIFIEETLIRYRQHSRQAVGGRKLNFIDKIKRFSRVYLTEKYFDTNKFYDLLKRVKQSTELSQRSINLINLKIKHLKRRNLIISATRKRYKTKIITTELISGNYIKFSNGVESILEDILMTFLK